MKHIAIIPIMLLALSATAQTKATVEHGAESKKVTAQYMATARQIGTYNGLCCWVGENKKERLTVTLTDQNMEPLGTLELPEGKQMRLLATTIDGKTAHLLLAEEGRRHMTLVYTSSVDLENMQTTEYTSPLMLIDSIGYGRKDECKVWAAASANGEHVGYVTIVELKDRKQYTARTVMLDRRMQQAWSKEFAMGSMDEMGVTDDGTVVTLGHDEDPGMTHFVYNVVSQTGADTYRVSVKCDPIREMHLAGFLGSHVLAMGLFRPQGTDPDENLTGGVVGLSFNLDSLTLDGFTMRPFQNEDINILDNKKTKKVQRDMMIDYVSTNALTTTGFGAVIAVGRNYQRTYSEDNGMTSNNYHRVGLHVVAMDTAANIRWVRNLRRNDMQKNGDELLHIGLLHAGDRTMLVKSECPKYPATYDISKEAKEFEMDSKSNMVMYVIGADGETEKLTLVSKTTHALLQVGRALDGKALLMTANGKRTRQTKLTID